MVVLVVDGLGVVVDFCSGVMVDPLVVVVVVEIFVVVAIVWSSVGLEVAPPEEVPASSADACKAIEANAARRVKTNLRLNVLIFLLYISNTFR